MKQTLTRRVLFWLLLVSFIGVAVWWCFYFPYDRERLYRAIPHEAVFVTEHEQLTDRWQEFSRNPLTRLLLLNAGLRPAEVKSITDDPDVAALIETLAPHDAVVAYVPSLAGTGRQAWVISSWLGGFGQALRWGSSSGIISDASLQKTRLEGGRRAWLLETGTREKLSLAIVEGMLLGCYSEDPTAVRYLVDRVERGAHLRPDLRKEVDAGDVDGCADRGWFSAYVRQSGARVPYTFRYTLDTHDADGSEGQVIGLPGRVRPPAGVNARLPEALASARKLIGADPDMLLLAPFGYAKPFLSGRGVPEGLTFVEECLDETMADDGYMFACLFGGEMSGRILGLRVPSLIIGAEVREESEGEAVASALLDRLNARYGWSLIPRLVEEGGQQIFVLDTGRGGLYGSIGMRERPAYAVKDGWFVFSSNMDVLARWLTGRLAPSSAGAAWQEAESPPANSAAYGWVDLQSTGQAVRNAIAVYSLALMAQNSAGNAATRRNLEEAKMWINALTPLETCALWLGEHEDEFDLRFRLGDPES